MPVNPRNQIRYIVNKVKAAGVFAVVSYDKRFNETHELSDSLVFSGEMKPVVEDQDTEEFDFAIASVQQPYPQGLSHEMSDAMMLSGVFDFTGFDTLNAFA
jgi:histidinol dehydrogenase